MKLRAVLLLTAMSVLAHTPPIEAAPPAKTVAQKSRTKVDPLRSLLAAPFDPSISKLPPSFEGNNLSAVIWRASSAPRGEFETSAEFAARQHQVSLSLIRGYPR